MVEKIVYDSTKDVNRKPKKKDPKEKGCADEIIHAKNIELSETGKGTHEKSKAALEKRKTKPAESPAEGKINKYGFLHLPKKLAEHLGASFGKDKADVPVTIEPIERGFIVKLKA